MPVSPAPSGPSKRTAKVGRSIASPCPASLGLNISSTSNQSRTASKSLFKCATSWRHHPSALTAHAAARYSAIQRALAQERAAADGIEIPPIKSEDVDKLKEENAILKGEMRARDAFIGMLQKEKQDQFQMFWNYTTKIAEQSRELGRLEERLSIEAPQESYPHMPKQGDDVRDV